MENQEILNEYEAAMFASNQAGYAGMTAEQVIRSLVERAEAAEAKLAELEKQDPYGFTHNYLSPPDNDHESIGIFKRENRHYGRPLFTRPAPAINLAELVPLKMVATADWQNVVLNDIIEASIDGRNDCRAAILRNIEEAK